MEFYKHCISTPVIRNETRDTKKGTRQLSTCDVSLSFCLGFYHCNSTENLRLSIQGVVNMVFTKTLSFSCN